MSGRVDPRRRRVALGVPAVLVLAGSGCGSLGGDTPAPVWYLLEDLGPAAAPAAGGQPIAQPIARPIAQNLLVAPVLASSFDDSVMLAYGRAANTRAHYKFAGWTERPARRIGLLVERRLEGRARFASVAQSTAGVRGDLMLNLSLEHLYHDVSSSPGRARVALIAELLHWRDRVLLARRSFERTAPVAREAADAAVDATNRAFSALLDDLCPWVEETAARAPAAG